MLKSSQSNHVSSEPPVPLAKATLAKETAGSGDENVSYVVHMSIISKAP